MAVALVCFPEGDGGGKKYCGSAAGQGFRNASSHRMYIELLNFARGCVTFTDKLSGFYEVDAFWARNICVTFDYFDVVSSNFI